MMSEPEDLEDPTRKPSPTDDGKVSMQQIESVSGDVGTQAEAGAAAGEGASGSVTTEGESRVLNSFQRGRGGKSGRRGRRGRIGNSNPQSVPLRSSRRLREKAEKHTLHNEFYATVVDLAEVCTDDVSESIIRQISGCSVEAGYSSADKIICEPPPLEISEHQVSCLLEPSEQHVSDPASSTYTCEECQKEYSTKNGFYKHRITHRIEDANSRRPGADALYPHAEKIMVRALEEITLECGEEKKKLVEEVLRARNTQTNDWQKLIETLTKPLIKNVIKASKIMPSSQYEEQLVELNKILNKPNFVNSIVNCLKSLYDCSTDSTMFESCVPRMVVFRLCFKILDELLVVVCESMKEACVDEPVAPHSTFMSEIELEAFVVHLRKLLVEYYKKGLKIKSNVWLSRCACIRECFVEIDNDQEPVSVDMMLKDSFWRKGESGKAHLRLSDEVIGFFVQVEHIIQSLIVQSVVSINCDSIMDIIFKAENSPMLNSWYSLSARYFMEEEALTFMRDLLSIVTNFSLKLEVGKILSVESQEKIQKYALRTDLKRN